MAKKFEIYSYLYRDKKENKIKTMLIIASIGRNAYFKNKLILIIKVMIFAFMVIEVKHIMLNFIKLLHIHNKIQLQHVNINNRISYSSCKYCL